MSTEINMSVNIAGVEWKNRVLLGPELNLKNLWI